MVSAVKNKCKFMFMLSYAEFQTTIEGFSSHSRNSLPHRVEGNADAFGLSCGYTPHPPVSNGSNEKRHLNLRNFSFNKTSELLGWNKIIVKILLILHLNGSYRFHTDASIQLMHGLSCDTTIEEHT